MPKKRFRPHGYHIVRSAANPNTTYLGTNREFVSLTKALLFLDHRHAREYAEDNGIELGDAHNVIMPCECQEHIRDQHSIPNGYY